MTKLTKPVAREVNCAGPNGASLIVTLTPLGITFREKRRRAELLLPYGYAYIRAAMLVADEVRAQRRRRPRRVARNLLSARTP